VIPERHGQYQNKQKDCSTHLAGIKTLQVYYVHILAAYIIS
jgi:hypothetical protein